MLPGEYGESVIRGLYSIRRTGGLSASRSKNLWQGKRISRYAKGARGTIGNAKEIGSTMKKRIAGFILVLLSCALLLPGCGQTPEDLPSDIPPGTQPAKQPESHLIDGFEIILQTPELPTGCEITALTMALRYYGFDADKATMASAYLPCMPANQYTGEDGRLYGSDLNQYFIGDPFSVSGIVCGTGAIVAAADAYLGGCGSKMRAEDLTGASPEELYQLVEQDIPVLVWVTIGMQQSRGDLEGWYTENGDYVEWGPNDHGAVLIGFTDNTVAIADPLYGQMEYSREAFEEAFASRNHQCVVLR